MRAFSLLEVLIVVGVFALLAGAGLPWSIHSYTRLLAGSNIDLIQSALARARGESLAQACEAPTCLQGSAHGVFIQDDAVTLFEGSSYTSREKWYDEVVPLNGIIQSEGVKEFVFMSTSAEAARSGEIIIHEENGKVHSISVNQEGGVTVQ